MKSLKDLLGVSIEDEAKVKDACGQATWLDVQRQVEYLNIEMETVKAALDAGEVNIHEAALFMVASVGAIWLAPMDDGGFESLMRHIHKAHAAEVSKASYELLDARSRSLLGAVDKKYDAQAALLFSTITPGNEPEGSASPAVH